MASFYNSARQQIIDRLKSKLALITIANGYSCNAGNNIYEWIPNTAVTAAMCDCIVIRDPLNPVIPTASPLSGSVSIVAHNPPDPVTLQSGSRGGIDVGTLDIEIAMFQLKNPGVNDKGNPAAATAARDGLTDLSKLILSDIDGPILGGLAMRVVRSARTVDIVQGANVIAISQISLVITHKTNFFDEV